MKKVLNTFFCTFLLAFVCMSLAACGSSVERGIAEANKQCPIELGMGISIDKIFLQDNNIVYLVTAPSEMLDGFASQKDIIKQAMMESLKSASSKDDPENSLVEMCKEENLGIEFVFTDGTKKVTIPIDPKEIN